MQAIHEVITQDEEIKKVQAAIVAGLEKSSTEMTEYLQLWMKYVCVWMWVWVWVWVCCLVLFQSNFVRFCYLC